MTSVAKGADQGVSQRLILGFLVLAVANIIVRRWKPDTLASTLVSAIYLGAIAVWFALRIRQGYRRRKPHWTRDSWMRYVRLAAMPVVAVVFVLLMSTESGIRMMGEARSTTRTVSALALTLLLALGSIGMVVALEWLMRGEPAEPFTRTGWFQRRKSNTSAS